MMTYRDAVDFFESLDFKRYRCAEVVKLVFGPQFVSGLVIKRFVDFDNLKWNTQRDLDIVWPNHP